MRTVLNYFKLPNSLLELPISANELSIIAYLHSVYQAAPRQQNMFGGEVSCKQETIANACHLSISTVARSVAHLQEVGLITGAVRRTRTDGLHGTYIYTLKLFDFAKEQYFCVSRKVLPLLKPSLFKTYLWVCKLADTNSCFFQSYSDLAELLQRRRSNVMKLIKLLAEEQLIRIDRKMTHAGDYTDNHYILIMFAINHIKRKCNAFRTSILVAFARLAEGAGKAFFDKGGGVQIDGS